MTTRARFDIEANGLLDTITKVHCLSWSVAVLQPDNTFMAGPVQRAVGHAAIRDAWEVIQACDEVAGHFIIGYDLLALNKVLKLRLRKGQRVIDTLTVSCLLFPDIDGEAEADNEKHSLAAWGVRLGEHKTDYQAAFIQWKAEQWALEQERLEVPEEERTGYRYEEGDEWVEYNPVMGDYCDQDVTVEIKLDDHLHAELQKWDWSQSLRIETRFAQDFAWQGYKGVYVDQPWIERLIRSIGNEMARIEQEIEPLLPPKQGTKGQIKASRPPKQIWKKDGNLTANTEKWFEEWRGEGRDREGLKFGKWWKLTELQMEEDDSKRKPLRTEFPASLSDQQHIKTWLMDSGWIPTMWNYKKAPDAKGKMRFVRDDKGKLIPTWPKFHDKGVLCPNLESIRSSFPGVALCVRWMVIRHRLGLVQSIKDNIRPDGTVSATGTALGTPTSRVTHKVVANIPKADKNVLLGKECRAMFIARPGRKFVGVDAAGLELRCLAHYVGSPELADMVCNGNSKDGTDIHSVLWKACQEFVRSRNEQKNVTYGWLYGASDTKLGTTAGHPEAKAEKVGSIIRARMVAAVPGLEALMKKIEGAAKVGYVKAIDGRRIEIRAKHATLNTLLQSCGSILVKMAQCYMNEQIRKRGLDAIQVISYHDEVQLDCAEKDAEEAGKLFIEGLQWAGKHVGFKCPLDGEVKIGNSWADTH